MAINNNASPNSGWWQNTGLKQGETKVQGEPTPFENEVSTTAPNSVGNDVYNQPGNNVTIAKNILSECQ